MDDNRQTFTEHRPYHYITNYYKIKCFYGVLRNLRYYFFIKILKIYELAEKKG